MKTYVYFVRHAQPDFSIKDDMTRPLTDKGIMDAKKVTKMLVGEKVDVIYSSPYKRSVDTIKDFADSYGYEVIIHDGFRERRVGKWIEDFEEFSKKQWEDFNYKLEGGESLHEVQERNVAALIEVINNNEGKSIVVGTHGTALSTIINHFTPDFGYESFWSIIDKMPYIIKLTFEGMDAAQMEEIEIF